MLKKRGGKTARADPRILDFLGPQEVLAIDRALEKLERDGQVHLIVEERRLSCIQTIVERVLVKSPKRIARKKGKKPCKRGTPCTPNHIASARWSKRSSPREYKPISP